MFSRLLRFGPVQIVLFLVGIVLAIICRDIVAAILGIALAVDEPAKMWMAPRGTISEDPAQVLQAVIAAAAMIALGFAAYRACVVYVEKRAPAELAMKGALTFLAQGALVGFSVVLFVVGALTVLGMIEVNLRPLSVAVLIPLAAAASAAFMEELLFRGILFRFLERGVGSWLALLLTATLFGAGHASNPNASVLSTISIAGLAGVALGLAYMATRSLWFPIGIHFAVNIVQGTVLGLPVSGKESVGIFASRLGGPALLTGGPFGLEASVLFLPAGGVAIAALLWLTLKRQQIRPPYWERRRKAAPSSRSEARA
ncbi:MAG: lysostaphin resistance A-like protein [Allosphingosinicella sp.]